MEINRQVSALRTSLSHIEKSLTSPFVAINARSREAQDCVRQITSDLRIQSFFVDKSNGHLRKLHLLLLINTDLPITAQLEYDGSVGHAVSAIPRLSPYLYFQLIYHYNLFKYVVEVIDHGPIMLVLELMNLINSEIKFIIGFKHFQIIVSVLLATISRIRRSNCDYTAKKLFEQFQMLMLHYKESDADEGTKKSNEKIEYEGHKFLNFITLLRKLTDICFAPMSDLRRIALYGIRIPIDPTQWYQKHELKEKSAIVSECYEIVFFKCRELMCNLDLDMFLTWHETQFAEGITLQNAVGEEVYRLCQVLELKKQSYSLPDATVELISMLQSVAVKPAVTSLSTDKSNTEQLEWLVLESRIFDMPFLQSIECFLQENRFRFDVVVSFVHKLCDVNVRPGIDDAFVKKISVLALSGLDLDEATSFLIAFLGKYGTNHSLVDPDVDWSPLIEQLNELYSNDVEQEEEYRKEKKNELAKKATLLAFYSTRATLMSLVRKGCLEKNKPAAIVKILDAMRPLCVYKPSSPSVSICSLLTDVLREFLNVNYTQLMPAERNNFTCLVLGLNSHRLFPNENFLVACVLPLLYLEENANRQTLADLLELFQTIYQKSQDKLMSSSPMILIQLAQILEESRWQVTTFSVERVKICERVIDVIELILKSVPWKSVIFDSQKWFEKQCRQFSPLTRSYFLSIVPSVAVSTIEMRLISCIHKPVDCPAAFMQDFTKDENAFVLHMGKLALACTYKELCRIAQNVGQNEYVYSCFIFDLISDGIAFMSNAVAQLSNFKPAECESMFGCLGHLINNFLNLLEKVGVTRRMIGDEVSNIRYINRITAILRLFPDQLINTYRFNIIKCVSELLPKLRETTHDFDGDARQLLIGLYLL